MLYLASQSPRRRQLLQEAGLAHEAIDPGIDDNLLTPLAGTAAGRGTSPAAWTSSLAYLKAASGFDRLSSTGKLLPGDVVLGADTICLTDDNQGVPRILSAPDDEQEARSMLELWQQGPHEVLTSVAILSLPLGGQASRVRTVMVDRACVRWGTVAPRDVDAYLASNAWRDKAGGYNLQERLAAGWPVTFEGDPTTIMGLPMRRLIQMFRELGLTSATHGAAARSAP